MKKKREEGRRGRGRRRSRVGSKKRGGAKVQSAKSGRGVRGGGADNRWGRGGDAEQEHRGEDGNSREGVEGSYAS